MGNSRSALADPCVLAENDVSAHIPQGCQVSSMGGLPIISLPAEVDVLNIHLLRDAVLEARAEGASVVVVDMTMTTYIGAAAIGVLLPLATRLHNSGGELRLVIGGAGMPQRLLIEVYQLNRFSRIFTNMTEVLADALHQPVRYAHAA
jgi:anti-anti-sigma factor